MDISSNINQLQSLIGNSPAQRDTKTSIDKKDQKELDEFLKIATMINNLIPLWLISKVFPFWFRKMYNIYEKFFADFLHELNYSSL